MEKKIPAYQSPDVAYSLRMATEALQSGNYSRALGFIEKTLSIDPDSAMAWHEKANCLDEMGRCEEALNCYETAIRLDSNHAEAWFNKGLTLKKMGREKEAFDCMSRGVDLALGK